MLQLNDWGLLLHALWQKNAPKKKLQSCGKCFIETFVYMMSKYFDLLAS